MFVLRTKGECVPYRVSFSKDKLFNSFNFKKKKQQGSNSWYVTSQWSYIWAMRMIMRNEVNWGKMSWTRQIHFSTILNSVWPTFNFPLFVVFKRSLLLMVFGQRACKCTCVLRGFETNKLFQKLRDEEAWAAGKQLLLHFYCPLTCNQTVQLGKVASSWPFMAKMTRFSMHVNSIYPPHPFDVIV